MNRVNENDIPWREGASPKGTYHCFGRHLARALEAPQAGPPLPPGVPFEVSLIRLPAGVANFPFHSHAAEWECYLILSGTCTVRHGDQRSSLRAGDCVLCPPGEPHQIINDGDDDLLYYVVANNAPVDVCHYPDSDKWAMRGSGSFRQTPVPYYESDE